MYLYTVTCFPIFFGKQDAVYPSVLIHLEKCLIFFTTFTSISLKWQEESLRIPRNSSRNRLLLMTRQRCTLGSLKRKTAWRRMLENPWRHGDQRVNQHQDQDPKIPPWQGEGSDSFVFGPLFLLQKEMFWMIFDMIWIRWSWCSLSYFQLNRMEGKRCISCGKLIHFMIQETFLIHLWIYSVFASKLLKIPEKAVWFMMASSRFRCNSDCSVWYCHWCELLHYPESAACSCISISAKT